VTADDNYLRESILNSQAKIVRGFQPIMPTFQGQMNEEDLLKLIAYLKSLGKPVVPGAVTPVESPKSFATSAGATPSGTSAPGTPGTTATTATAGQPGKRNNP
jgi:hypothetical protein